MRDVSKWIFSNQAECFHFLFSLCGEVGGAFQLDDAALKINGSI